MYGNLYINIFGAMFPSPVLCATRAILDHFFNYSMYITITSEELVCFLIVLAVNMENF